MIEGRPRPASATLSPSSGQVGSEVVGKGTLPNCTRGLLHVVLHAYMLDCDPFFIHLQDHVTGAGIPILGPPDGACIDEKDPVHLALPGQVGVPEADNVTSTSPSRCRHFPREVVWPIFSPIERVEGRRAMHEDDCGA